MTTAPGAAAGWPALVDAASARYRGAGRYARSFARAKLAMDPVFGHLLQTGLIPPGVRVLDIGCGQGLLASLVHVSDESAARGAWPRGWAPAPVQVHVTGIELLRRDVTRARRAMGDAAEFICGDMRATPFPATDVVVILDALHYIPVKDQDQVLARVRAAMPTGGRLILRIGDAGARRGFIASQWVDRLVASFRGQSVRAAHGRTTAQWSSHLEELGFVVRSEPMSRGTPFSNVLLVAQLPGAASASTP